MRLLILAEGKNSVVAEIDDSGECPLLDFLSNPPSNLTGSADGFLSLFERYAEFGTEQLTAEQFHPADNNGIYRFRKGRLRVYCFMDGANLVVCTHGTIKKSQKTQTKDSAAAKANRKRYDMDKQANKIALISIEEYDNE